MPDDTELGKSGYVVILLITNVGGASGLADKRVPGTQLFPIRKACTAGRLLVSDVEMSSWTSFNPCLGKMAHLLQKVQHCTGSDLWLL